MLRRAGVSLHHFSLERNSSAGHSLCSREVWNAQWDCSWLAACPGPLTLAARADRARQEKPLWCNILCACLLPGSVFKGDILHNHKQGDILHRGEGSLFVGLLHLMVSTRPTWLVKYLENISIPLRDPNMQSKAVTHRHQSQWWKIMDAKSSALALSSPVWLPGKLHLEKHILLSRDQSRLKQI